MFFKCLLAQDSNAYAKEILDLVNWSNFKLVTILSLEYYFQYLNSIILKFESPIFKKLRLLNILLLKGVQPYIHWELCKNYMVFQVLIQQYNIFISELHICIAK